MVHFSEAVAGFCSIHKSQVQGVAGLAGTAGGDAGVRVNVKTSRGLSSAALLTDSSILTVVIEGEVNV